MCGVARPFRAGAPLLVVLAGHNPNFLAALFKELERVGVSPSG